MNKIFPSHFIPKTSVEIKEVCVAGAVTLVALAAIGFMVVGAISLFNQTSLTGWNSLSSYEFFGGAAFVGVLSLALASYLLRQEREEPVAVFKERLSMTVEETVPINPNEAAVSDWKTQFPLNALRRLAEQRPPEINPPKQLTPEQIQLLGDKIPFVYGSEETAESEGIWMGGGDHIVFKIEELEGFFFKVPREDLSFEQQLKHAKDYIALKENARQICRENGLYLLQIPNADYVQIGDRIVIVEEAIPNLRGNHEFQKELYQWGLSQPQLTPYFKRLFEELLIMVSELGFADFKYNNIPISLDGYVGLIDLDDWGAAFGLVRSFGGGKFNIGYSNQGLLNYLPTEWLDEFIAKANQRLGDQWIDRFVSKLEAGDVWLNRLARKELGLDRDSNSDPQEAKLAVERVQQNPDQLIALIKNMPANDEWLRGVVGKMLGFRGFQLSSQRVEEIKSRPEETLLPFIFQLDEQSETFLQLGKKILVEEKVAEIRSHPRMILELIRRRIEKRANRQQAYERFVREYGSDEMRLSDKRSFRERVRLMRAEGELDPQLNSTVVYETAQLLVTTINHSYTETLSVRRNIQWVFDEVWENDADKSVYKGRPKSFQIVKAESFRTNIDAALKVLQKENGIFRFRYQHSRAGINASEYVTIEF